MAENQNQGLDKKKGGYVPPKSTPPCQPGKGKVYDGWVPPPSPKPPKSPEKK